MGLVACSARGVFLRLVLPVPPLHCLLAVCPRCVSLSSSSCPPQLFLPDGGKQRFEDSSLRVCKFCAEHALMLE